MAQESIVEAAARKQREKEAAEAAARAEQKAQQRVQENPDVAASKAKQDAEEAAADAAARQEAAKALAGQNAQNAALLGGTSGVAPVTPNAGGLSIPVTPVKVAVDEVPLTGKLDTAIETGIGYAEAPWRTFQHLYANANTIMPNGKKIIFGGQNGHVGQYSTNKKDQIEHLVELANTPGSMVTEVRKDAEGRYIVVTDAILEAETRAALIDSRTNTARQQDPNVAQAMNNLGRTIAQDS